MRKLAVKKLTSLNSFSYTGLMSVYEKERGDLLEKAFESILNQTILPAYFVLVRDGILPQRLNDVINAAKNSFIRVGIEFIELTNATNLGLGKSLNKGLKACPTELVARFDSDDVNLHNRMENTLAYFSANSNIAVVGGQISEWDVSPDLSTGIRQVPTSYEAIKNLAQRRNPFNHMSVTFRKSVINSVGSYQNVLLFEDYYLWIRVIQ
ncbi:glycosyltransferase, partial [Lactiplantibacillus garii]